MGGWIKLEKDLRDDVRVSRMAAVLAKTPACNGTTLHPVTLVLGGLVQLWMHADSFARDDDTLDTTLDEIDQLAGIKGFAKALPPDWLEVIDEHTVKLPGFQSHNGIEAKRLALTAKRVEKHRKRVKRNGVTESTTPVTHERYQTETRPDQDHEEGGAEGDARASPSPTNVRRKGTRVPEPFEVTEEMRTWAAEKCPHVGVEVATEEFVDYWRGVAGRHGVKLDWPGTWRNRLRELEGRATRIPAGTKPAASQGGWQ